MRGAGLTFFAFLEESRKWIFSLIIIPVSYFIIINRGTFTFIDNADLIIHEAGHLIFFFFGKFIYTLGGTLMQIIIPYIIVHYFKSHEYKTGTQIGLLWMGQNFINISVYAADASAKSLPLLGGKAVYHDWNYMLGELNLLQYDAEVGYFFVGLAVITFLISVFVPLIIHD